MNDYTNNTAQAPRKYSRKKLFFIGLGVAVTGLLSFFGINYWQKHKEQTTSPDAKAPDFKAEQPASNTASTTTKPKAAAKHKVTKSKTATKPKTKGSAASPAKEKTESSPIATPINPSLVAKGFYTAILVKNFKTAMLLLKTLKSVDDYSAVSKAFSALKVNVTHKTLVEGLVGSFTQDTQKTAIHAALTAIGLKYDGKKWSLSGIEKTTLITTQGTKVWKDPQHSVAVPLNMVLGKEVAKRGHFTLFENDRQYFLVESQHVKPYSN